LRYGLRHRKRRSRENHRNRPRWNGSRFHSGSRNWRSETLTVLSTTSQFHTEEKPWISPRHFLFLGFAYREFFPAFFTTAHLARAAAAIFARPAALILRFFFATPWASLYLSTSPPLGLGPRRLIPLPSPPPRILFNSLCKSSIFSITFAARLRSAADTFVIVLIMFM
jgi:hypothetical protein